MVIQKPHFRNEFYLHLQADMSLAVPVGSTDMPFLDIHPT
jgi:hypothetical protein